MSKPTETVAEFLLARIAEQEEQARRAEWSISPTMWSEDLRNIKNPNVARHVAGWSPEHVLAECEAKRFIIAEANDYSPELEHGDNGEWAFDSVLQLLALPYANHKDYVEDWKVSA